MKEILFAAKGGNRTHDIVKLLNENKNDVKIVFENKEYHFYRDGCSEGVFYPSNNKYGHKYVVFLISDSRNVTIDGGGATFVFHDRVFPFIIRNTHNVKLENFTVDFAFPRCYSAVVKDSTDTHLDFYIDKKKYPYSVSGGHMICHTESEDISSADAKFFLSDYDKDVENGTTIASIMIGDCELPPDAFPADGLRTDASEIGGDIVRFTYRKNSNKLRYLKGHNIVFHFDEDRQYDTFFVDECKRVTFDNVEINRGAGMGLIAQFSDDLTLDKMKIRRKDGRGDLVSTTADALMFVNCGGKVTLKNSYIANSLDDGFNLHGFYTHIEEILPDGLKVRLGHREQVGTNPFRKGDKMTVIDGKTLKEKETLKVVSAVLEPDNKHIKVVTEKPPEFAAADDFAENPERMPEVEFVDNVFEMCPSIIIASSKKVHFARNRIHSRCAGLRIIDSPKLWYESGRSHNVLIEDNEFVSCGEGYDEYTLCVSVNAEFECEKDHYIHENITVRNNKFKARNGKIFTAAYAKNVLFENNEFIKTARFENETETSPYRIERCKDLVIRNNTIRF